MSLKATTAGASNEPILHCPKCNHEIRLTESLAAPLLAETRQRFQQRLASEDAEMERKTEALRLEREQISDTRCGDSARARSVISNGGTPASRTQRSELCENARIGWPDSTKLRRKSPQSVAAS
ncbi:hypothetical protein [Bradyrhizobium cenepequi]|uniref:hypothetical protein n=1 Tax=Bradyrhizobium cenepequi TaxID=2821403 RepID=UPI001CE2FDC1|nr:hypothetical protein [Bradyrhizobium cenepequi]